MVHICRRCPGEKKDGPGCQGLLSGNPERPEPRHRGAFLGPSVNKGSPPPSGQFHLPVALRQLRGGVAQVRQQRCQPRMVGVVAPHDQAVAGDQA